MLGMDYTQLAIPTDMVAHCCYFLNANVSHE